MIKLRNADMRRSEFDDINFAETRFNNVNLGHATFNNINMGHTTLEDVYLVGTQIRNAKSMEGMTIDGVLVSDLLACWEANQPTAECAEVAAVDTDTDR